MELLVDGVQRCDEGVGEAERELEEEVWVAEERFVDIERDLPLRGFRGLGCGGCGGCEWDIRTPDRGCYIAATVMMTAENARCVISTVFIRHPQGIFCCALFTSHRREVYVH